MKLKLNLLFIIFALPLSIAQAGEPIDVFLDVEGDEAVDIEIVNGEITILGWDQNTVQITGELSEAATGYIFETRNGVVYFEEDIPDNFFRRNCFGSFNCNDEGAILVISVPNNSELEFEGVNIELSVQDLENNTEIELVNGSITADNLSGVVTLGTVNGGVESTNLDGRIRLATVNGNILDRDSSGTRATYNAVNGALEVFTAVREVNAETVSGSIDLDLDEVDDLEVSTVNGNVQINLGLSEFGQAEISTVNGNTNLIFNSSISARFTISTAIGGEIINYLSDDEAVRENRFANSSELNFILNSSDANVDISTLNGNITLDSD